MFSKFLFSSFSPFHIPLSVRCTLYHNKSGAQLENTTRIIISQIMSSLSPLALCLSLCLLLFSHSHTILCSICVFLLSPFRCFRQKTQPQVQTVSFPLSFPFCITHSQQRCSNTRQAKATHQSHINRLTVTKRK